MARIGQVGTDDNGRPILKRYSRLHEEVADTREALEDWRQEHIRKFKPAKLTAKKMLSFLRKLRVVQGGRRGQKLRVLPWQQEFVEAFCDPAVRELLLTCARGNGKTYALAGIALSYFLESGPFRIPNSTILIYGSSQAQAQIMFDYIHQMARMATLPKEWGKLPEKYSINIGKELRNNDSQIRIIARTFSARSAQGAAPVLCYMDELASMDQRTGAYLLSTIATSRGKQPGAKYVLCGLRPDDESHFYSMEMSKEVPGRKVFIYSASGHEDVFSDAAMEAANPSLEHLPDLKAAIIEDRELARKDPSKEREYRSDRLNLGSSPAGKARSGDFVTAAQIRAMAAREEKPRGGPVALGIDAGSSDGMSAVCMYWYTTGRVEVYAGLPVAVRTLAKWEERDWKPRGLYEDFHRRGELKVYPTADEAINYLLKEVVFPAVGNEKVTALLDSFQLGDLKRYMAQEASITDVHYRHPRGRGDHGFQHRQWTMDEIATGRMWIAENTLLVMSLGGVHSVVDATGTPRIEQKDQFTRKDAADAFMMGIAAGRARRLGYPLSTKEARAKPKRKRNLAAVLAGLRDDPPEGT